MKVQLRLSKVLSEFARTLGADFSLQAVLDELVVRVVDVLPISGAAVTLMSPGTQPRCVAASDESASRGDRLQIAYGQGPCFTAYETGEPVAVVDLRVDDRFRRFAGPALASGVTSALSFALRQGDVRVGALNLYRTGGAPFDDESMAAAQTLADVTATYLLIDHARTSFRKTTEQARLSSLDGDEAVRALRSSEQRKAAILASALDAVITIDEHGSVIEFNPAAEGTFGISCDEAAGVDLTTLVAPPYGLGRWIRLDRDLPGLEGPVAGRRLELVGTRSDGSTFPAEVSITAVEGLAPPFFTAFIRDLSRREADVVEKRNLETRVHQTERLESLGQLAGGVAHDFNNLLTVILNSASFIVDDNTNDAATRAFAADIVSSAEQAGRLTRQLLQFARREPVQRSPIDIPQIVADIRDLLARTIGEHVHLVVRSATDLPAVTGDRGQTEQLLMNLAVNARDAMPDGGTLTIETAEVKHGSDRFVQLSVTDTGEGMSAEVAAHAFEPFFTTKRAGEGAGLGLATVYGIVHEAGGTMTMTSEEGHGTAVRVELPLVRHPADLAPAAVTADPASGSGETILVVEDQLSVRTIIVTMLNRNGYRVLEAPDATTALALAATEKFDLLLTDVVMPGLSGRELADALGGPVGHGVLYMSGYSGGVFGTQRALDRREALIHKPFNEAALLTAIRAALTTTDLRTGAPVACAQAPPAAADAS